MGKMYEVTSDHMTCLFDTETDAINAFLMCWCYQFGIVDENEEFREILKFENIAFALKHDSYYEAWPLSIRYLG